jgi:drug/metabolite transporter (DMT)-like permease
LIFQFKRPTQNANKFFFITFLAGLVIALDLFVWHKSILKIGAGLATVLGNTQVIYMVLFSVFIFKEKLKLNMLLALIFSLIGVLLIINIQLPEGIVKKDFLQGCIYGLLTGIAYATFMLLLKKLETEVTELTTLEKLLWVYFFSSIVLCILALTTEGLQWPKKADWVWLVALGLLVNIGGWKLITSGLAKVSTATAGLLLLIQPAGATLWGVIIFNEKIKVQQLFGISFLFLGLYLVSVKRKQKVVDENVA